LNPKEQTGTQHQQECARNYSMSPPGPFKSRYPLFIITRTCCRSNDKTTAQQTALSKKQARRQSAIRNQQSAIRQPLTSTISNRQLGNQQSAIQHVSSDINRQSTIDNQQSTSAIDNQQSKTQQSKAISNRQNNGTKRTAKPHTQHNDAKLLKPKSATPRSSVVPESRIPLALTSNQAFKPMRPPCNRRTTALKRNEGFQGSTHHSACGGGRASARGRPRYAMPRAIDRYKRSGRQFTSQKRDESR